MFNCRCISPISYLRSYVMKNKQSALHYSSKKSQYFIESHIKTSNLQHFILTIGSGLGSLFNPYKADLIATFGETSGINSLKKIHETMLKDSVGKRILDEKPIVTTDYVDLQSLRRFPENSFGRLYTQFLDYYGYNPNERNVVSFVEDPELAYLILRYRQIHDFVHVLLAQPTSILGEINVKWVEALQTKLPLALLAGFFGPLQLDKDQIKRYLEVDLPYVIRVGRRAKFLISIYYEEMFAMDITEMRAILNILEPPSLPEFYFYNNNYFKNTNLV